MSDSSTSTTPRPKPFLRPLGKVSLIWQMIGLALAIHLVLLLALSPGMFSSGSDSPDAIYKQGEDELARGNYTEAMAKFQKVLDMQPKIPPVFEKAAEQHRIADRLLRRGPAPSATQPAPTDPDPRNDTRPSTRIIVKPANDGPATPATRSTNTPFIPPELR